MSPERANLYQNFDDVGTAEIDFALGYSEPDAGSDLASLKLHAKRADSGWKLNGQKRFSTSAHFAHWYWVATRTNPDAPKHKGITLWPGRCR
ncbi:hypothetical protein Rruber_05437 (plasmid) [Rhodococcus ruber]|uniref:acyl-CoA dehydrogenase family protein n=1 Tax=Rhodococcus ruber TaxID=1830 RepID=UPI00315D94DD